MAANESEAYLTGLALRTFLKLWSYPNPFRAPGKEIADLLVVFGDEVIVFSDKASIHGKGEPVLAWQRWYERTVAESIKQLAGAIRPLTDPLASVYVDGRATQAFPFTLPAPEKRRLHLIAVVHPDRNPKAQPQNWPGLSFDSAVLGAESPFRVGRLAAKSLPVHLFDGKTLEDLLQEL